MDYLRGERIHFKAIDESYVDRGYLEWLSDYQVVRYLEARWTKNDRESIRSYIRHINEMSNSHLFGIFTNEKDAYIGNIKLSCPEYVHRTGEIGLFIGDRHSWGRGYGTEAIELMTAYGFNVMGFRKITAGIYESNLPSIRAFEKAGYQREYVSKQSFYHEGMYIDGIFMSLFKDDSDGGGA